MSQQATRDDTLSTPAPHPKYRRSEELGNEITELCAYIFAATYQLLAKIRPVRRLLQSGILRRLRTDL